jgi:Icc-related predicted phosphoesterase
MRLLLASDLHYALPHYDWIASVAHEFDVVVLAGDHLDIVSPVDIDAQIVALRATLQDLAGRTRLLVASGNHDLNTRDVNGEKTADWLDPLREVGAVVDGDTLELGDTVFTVAGWWDGPVAQAAVEEQLATVAVDGRRWIWVYHSPPEGPLAWTGSRHFGDPVVAAWIERFRPAAVLMGHIHQAPFTPAGSWMDRMGDTLLFNAGKQLGPVPAHIEIDLDAGTATWTSYQGVDTRTLRTAPDESSDQ